MKVLVKSHRGGRTLSPEWVMAKYKQELARKHRKVKKLQKEGCEQDLEKPTLKLDNSEVWMKEPKTIDDLVWIAQQINETSKVWGAK